MSLRPLTRAVLGRRLGFRGAHLFSATPPRPRFLNTVPRCPSPTCECADTPEMPQGLPIDYDAKLNGLIASYAEQVLVCTGRNDWSSRIEEDNSGDNLAADLKELIGRGGIYSDPFHNISVLNASFPSSISRRPEVQTTSAYLLPSFKYVPFLPRVSFDSVEALVKGYLLPEKLHPMNYGLPQIHKDRLLRKEAYQHLLHGVRDVDDVLVLICGHGGRDMRCGVMGPVLQAEFERQLPQAGLEVLRGPLIDEGVSVPALPGTGGEKPSTARVGLISHIGGHKFAGNIIIYLPPAFQNSAGNPHPLAGHGVWYGRIEPKHVEGVIRETIVKGTIQGPQWTLLGLIFAVSAGTAYLSRRQPSSLDDDVINTSTFTAFTIIDREQVSPTAFIITLRPSVWVDPESLNSRPVEGEPIGFLSTSIQEAWRHGLWSVEIKQPQLQIARHYTPLPPLPTTAEHGNVHELQVIQTQETGRDYEEQEEQANLRILIRRMDGGEMSNYLSRQRVGDTVWLRGPHLGFDIPRRLGNDNGHDSGTGANRASRGQRGVVFLAGGTGIAPALQIAHKLLDDHDSGSTGESRPHISILWANRWGVDALGREPPSLQRKSNSWFRFWTTEGSNPATNLQDKRNQTDKEPASSLALQIRDLKRRFPSHFEISYFVDDEGSFIEVQNVEAALASTWGTRGTSSPSINIDRRCTWHCAKAVELLPDDNDAARSSSSDPACACTCIPDAKVKTCAARPCINLVCVSGPDGFIDVYTGRKKWHEGNEMQGSIRGVLGRIQSDKEKKTGDWLVLKL
ncbi:Sucrase/ferredoxin-like-domain-containing protein [Xylaria telfairii]|nr:Sucrase/ferredoxin-like-domain-containing protein [Xylaria telfairii]